MGKYKTKPIQTDVGTFMHIPIYSSIFRHTRHKQTYSGIVQAYSEPCITLAYSGVLYIKNPGIFKTRSIFRTMVYPKLWQIQNQRHIKNQKHAQNLVKPL